MLKTTIILTAGVFLFSCSNNDSENLGSLEVSTLGNNDRVLEEDDEKKIKVFSTSDDFKAVTEKYDAKVICDEDYEHPEDGDVACVTKISFTTGDYPDLEVSGSTKTLGSADINQDGQEELIHFFSPRGAWIMYTVYALAEADNPNTSHWVNAFTFTHYVTDDESPDVYWYPSEQKVKVFPVNNVVDGTNEAEFDWKVD